MLPFLAPLLGGATEAAASAAASAVARQGLTQAARSLLPRVLPRLLGAGAGEAAEAAAGALGRRAVARSATEMAEEAVERQLRRRAGRETALGRWRDRAGEALYGRQGGIHDFTGGSWRRLAERALPEVAMNGLFTAFLPPEYNLGDKLALAASGSLSGLLGGVGAAGVAAKTARRMGVSPKGIAAITPQADMLGSLVGSVLPATGMDPITNAVNSSVEKRLQQEQQQQQLALEGQQGRDRRSALMEQLQTGALGDPSDPYSVLYQDPYQSLLAVV